MIKQINELYEEILHEGKKISEILISEIGYAHLRSELNNWKTPPKWVDILKIKENFSGFKIVPEGEQLGAAGR